MKGFLSLVVLCGLASAASAADASSFWSRLYKALTADTAQRYASHGMRMSSVAAVRGAPLGEQDPAEPYWKGGATDASAKELDQERKEFASAVQLALDGKMAASTAALEAFEKSHPKSALLPDVNEALAQAKDGAKAQSKEAAAVVSGKAAGGDADAEGCSDQPSKTEKGCASAASGEKAEEK